MLSLREEEIVARRQAGYGSKGSSFPGCQMYPLEAAKLMVSGLCRMIANNVIKNEYEAYEYIRTYNTRDFINGTDLFYTHNGITVSQWWSKNNVDTLRRRYL